jgi:hypothetical protein
VVIFFVNDIISFQLILNNQSQHIAQFAVHCRNLLRNKAGGSLFGSLNFAIEQSKTFDGYIKELNV